MTSAHPGVAARTAGTSIARGESPLFRAITPPPPGCIGCARRGAAPRHHPGAEVGPRRWLVSLDFYGGRLPGRGLHLGHVNGQNPILRFGPDGARISAF